MDTRNASDFVKTNVNINRDEYRLFRKILIDRGESFGPWVRKKIREEIKRYEPQIRLLPVERRR